MQTKSRVIGSHVYFVEDGTNFTVPAAGTSGRNSKPGADDASWIDFGIINNLSVNPQFEEKEIFAPSPGQLRLYDLLQTKRKLTVKFECEELQLLSFRLAFGSQSLTPSADGIQYNPLKGGVLKGWLNIEQYDESDNLINTVDVYCRIKVGGEVAFNDDVVKTSFEVEVLYSTLNTGEIAAEPE